MILYGAHFQSTSKIARFNQNQFYIFLFSKWKIKNAFTDRKNYGHSIFNNSFSI
jgi:hypothetical protein